MHFSRLRLSGFKSFVDPTVFIIEPGLTGVVGPNGCGKSNLLEGLRWVMGAASAKAMRGDGMDDVIFSGSGARPSRNHAEVTLTVDFPDGRAPGRFVGESTLEVSRRIDRGAGSTYRINGVETRARDVQLLFADASTGASSPALVRQGQISELIAAKPQNRRRILEEAAGVSGLYGRRHEAQIRVRAAEANLLRLDDVARELESGLGRLRREARAAARYRKLSSDIRTLQSAIGHARWREAVDALAVAQTEAAAARLAVERATRAAAGASTVALEAEGGLPNLREADTAAAAVLHHLTLEMDRQDRALAEARQEVQRLTVARARIASDLEREERAAADADGALSRLKRELTQLETEIAAAPEKTPELEANARRADEARAAAETQLEAMAARVAGARADARSAQLRLQEARGRASRVLDALARVRTERVALGPVSDPSLDSAVAHLADAARGQTEAREALDLAERRRAEAVAAENSARQAARAAEDALGRKLVEARGLAQLTEVISGGGFATVLRHIASTPGLEAALAAALGDDVGAALDPRAASHWRGRDVDPPVWPPGVTPLSPLITAPSELASRMAYVGLVAQSDGAKLQPQLPPGARLVSREGDLWRWDGLTVSARAPRPAQVRLEQKTRLAALEGEIDSLRPGVDAAKTRMEVAVAALLAADDAVKRARPGPKIADVEAARARDTLDQLRKEADRREAKALSLQDTENRLESEYAEAAAGLTAAEQAVAAIPPETLDDGALTRAREGAARTRESAFAARAELDRENAVRGARLRRQESLRRDHADWIRRTETARRRQLELAAERRQLQAALDEAWRAPEAIEARHLRIGDELASARARKTQSSEALSAAEAVRIEAARAAREAEAAAGEAREHRVSAELRLEAAQSRVHEQAAAIQEATGLDPEALGRRLAEDAAGLPAAVGGAEALLEGLERDRNSLGAVNLLAQEEADELAARLTTMATERADLSGAIGKLRQAIEELNAEGRERLTAAFEVIDRHFRDLFTTLFQGGAAELRLVESDDPLEAGLEILACPPGKRLTVMSLMSGGEQALTAVALIFAVFLANPAPICVLDEVDAPLDDANVERFCDLLADMRRRASTRFLTITHNPLTMSRMDRLFGVTMRERGVSQLVSVDLRQAEALAAR